jgi:tetratricopeptide (TPR) repeat protein
LCRVVPVAGLGVSHPMKKNTKTALLIFAVALLLRLFYLSENIASPYFGNPILDEMYLDNQAMDMVAGVETEGPYFRAPLYPWMLGAIYSVSLTYRFLLVALVQHVMGAITCVLLFGITTEAFGRRAGILAGFLSAVYAPLIFYEGELLIVTLFIFLNAGTLFLLLQGARRDNLWLLLAGGCTLGLSVITRPNILLFVPAAVLWVLLAIRGGAQRRLVRAAVTAMPIVMIIGGITCRNYMVSKELVLVSSQGGINFYIGNNPRATGMPPPTRKTYGTTDQYRDAVEVSSDEILQQATGEEFTPGDISDMWYDVAFSFVREDTASWLALTWKKFVLFWNDHEIRNNKSYYFCKRYSALLRLLPVSYGVLAVLAVLGVAARARSRPLGPMVLIILYADMFMLAVVLFFVCARLRLPVVVGLVPLAAAGIDAAITAGRSHRRRFAVYVPVIVVCSVLIFPDWYHTRSDNYSQDNWIVGKCCYDAKRFEEAAEAFRASIEQEETFFAGAHWYLGNCYWQNGERENAVECYAGILEREPENARALNALGVAAQAGGDRAKAMAYYTDAIRAAPGFAKARTNRGILLVEDGLMEAGRTELMTALSLDGNDPETYLGLALCAHLAGDGEAYTNAVEMAVAGGGSDYATWIRERIEKIERRDP